MSEKWYATKADGMCCDTNFAIDYEGAHWSTCMAAVVDEDGETVALVVDVNDQLSTAEFNERMRWIAAAPDLLAALESIVEMSPALPMGMIEAAHAAIAKARGE